MWLCREIKTGKIVALKKLRKAEMVRRGQIEHVKAERDVLAGIHNPFIVRLYYSFQVHLSGSKVMCAVAKGYLCAGRETCRAMGLSQCL